jgi:hypothetical protein
VRRRDVTSGIPEMERKRVFRFSQNSRQRRGIIREDREYLEARVRRFLTNYLSANEIQKNRYYEVVAAASAGCQPKHSVSVLESNEVAEKTADVASKVVRQRHQTEMGNQDNSLEPFITDAYATAAVAYRRAAGIYANDKKMQQLGTASVHLLTMATSRMMARSKD